jgi:hypothetical protein
MMAKAEKFAKNPISLRGQSMDPRSQRQPLRRFLRNESTTGTLAKTCCSAEGPQEQERFKIWKLFTRYCCTFTALPCKRLILNGAGEGNRTYRLLGVLHILAGMGFMNITFRPFQKAVVYNGFPSPRVV